MVIVVTLSMSCSDGFPDRLPIDVALLLKIVEEEGEDVPDPDKADPLAMIIDLGNGKGSRQIIFDKPEVKPINAIKTELESFASAIVNNTSPLVSINDGYAALDVAYRIIEKMDFDLKA